jgi:hypothetical protein
LGCPHAFRHHGAGDGGCASARPSGVGGRGVSILIVPEPRARAHAFQIVSLMFDPTVFVWFCSLGWAARTIFTWADERSRNVFKHNYVLRDVSVAPTTTSAATPAAPRATNPHGSKPKEVCNFAPEQVPTRPHWADEGHDDDERVKQQPTQRVARNRRCETRNQQRRSSSMPGQCIAEQRVNNTCTQGEAITFKTVSGKARWRHIDKIQQKT